MEWWLYKIITQENLTKNHCQKCFKHIYCNFERATDNKIEFFLTLKKMLRNEITRALSATTQLARRGRTGSKTHFYSSLGNLNYLKKRTARNKFEVKPIEHVLEITSGSRKFKEQESNIFGFFSIEVFNKFKKLGL